MSDAMTDHDTIREAIEAAVKPLQAKIDALAVQLQAAEKEIAALQTRIACLDAVRFGDTGNGAPIVPTIVDFSSPARAKPNDR
jgi:hypothetical protein